MACESVRGERAEGGAAVARDQSDWSERWCGRESRVPRVDVHADAKLADYDWDALASAATLLDPAPTRLTAQLDRADCLARHAHLERRERDLDNAKQVRTARAVIGPGKRSSAALLHQLDPLKDGFLASILSLNQPARGKLLPVRIISQPLRTVSVQFVVEDARGNPVPVQLFHVPTTSIPQDQLQDWFPVGAIFGIKEPLFRSLQDGSYYIRIETPVDIIRLYPHSPLLTNVRFPSPPGTETSPNTSTGTSTPHWLDSVAGSSPARLKEAGDKAFATGRLVRAKEAYQLALDALQGGDTAVTSTPPTADDDQLHLRVKVHANLAQTLLRLELPELAHRAAQAGLLVLLESSWSPHITSIAPLRIKLLYRRALGLYRVGQYDLAMQACEEAIRRCIAAAAADHADKNLNSSFSEGEATALLERIKQRQLEAEQGPSAETLRSLWESSVERQRASSPSSSPSFPAAAEMDLPPADWIDSSSISISPHIPGKQGHGLVALRPIKRGQLLMCCKPLASAGGGGPREGQRRYRYTVGVNLWTRSEDPWAVREVVSQVLWQAALEGEGEGEGGSGSLAGRKRTREAIAPLWAGTQLGRCRDPNRDRLPEDDVDIVSPSKVEGAVTFNGFHLEDVTASSSSSAPVHKSSVSPSAGRTNPDDDSDKDELFHAPTALYPEYPSALNHSCLSNCTYTFLSSVFLLRARVDIAPGEELVDSYVDAADRLEVRAAKLAAHGFECACPLCVEERQAGAKVRRRRVELVRRAEEEELEEPRRRRGLDKLGQIISELEQTYPATAHIRPALYTPLRLLSEALAAGATPFNPQSDPILNELRALQSLGARFSTSTTTGSSEGFQELVEPPRVRDMDGVMSALWIAKEWRRRGEPGKCRHWISLARSIEAGQAGEALFDLRYGDWARKHGLDLKL